MLFIFNLLNQIKLDFLVLTQKKQSEIKYKNKILIYFYHDLTMRISQVLCS